MAEAGSRMTIDAMAKDLAAIAGQENVTVYGKSLEPEYQIPALLGVSPAEERQVQNILTWADVYGIRIAPRGGGTKDAFGAAGFEADVILSMRRMSGILQHSTGDLTVTVLPGTPLCELQNALHRHGQFLPLDPAWEADSTIGGIAASNASGPRRARYGSVRDHLIASRVVYPDGTLIRTGAKVVKNVAGYDMNKLFVGAMGTLGVFTELTFKIRPLSAYAGTMLIHAADLERTRQFLEVLSDSGLEPCAVEWLNGSLSSRLLKDDIRHPVLLVSFEDVEQSVRYQLRVLLQACAEFAMEPAEQLLGREKSEAIFTALNDRMPSSEGMTDGKLILMIKVLSLMSEVPAIGEFAQQSAEDKGLDMEFRGGCFTGISRAVIRADLLQQDLVLTWLAEVEKFLGKLGGRCVLEAAPRSLKPLVQVWGKERADWKLMKEIKNKIDPKRILNPGRFVGGI